MTDVAGVTFPRRHVAALHDLALRVLEKRGDATKPELIARDLLDGFYDVCMAAGLDGSIDGLERVWSMEIPDGSALAEESRLRSALAARLAKRDEFDPRGPRNAKPRQLAECLLAALAVTVADAPERAITLGDDVRGAVVAAIAGVVDVALARPRLRAAILARAREWCEPPYLDAFDRIAPELDDRAATVPRRLKLPLDAVQAVQRVLGQARAAVLEQVATDAIDRAKHVIAEAHADAAARIDLPITARLTPREVAILRACDARAAVLGDVFARALFDSLCELAELAWEPAAPAARRYAPGETFAVGDLVDHPKFGRGTVQAASSQRIEVEFAEGWHTLIHARTKP